MNAFRVIDYTALIMDGPVLEQARSERLELEDRLHYAGPGRTMQHCVRQGMELCRISTRNGRHGNMSAQTRAGFL